MFTRRLMGIDVAHFDLPKWGDVVLCNKKTLELFATPDYEQYSPDSYEPIGVVVIPADHDVYGTGECGIVSLRAASLTTPDVGQANPQSNVSFGDASGKNLNIQYLSGLSLPKCDDNGNFEKFVSMSYTLIIPTDSNDNPDFPNPSGEPNSSYFQHASLFMRSPSPFWADDSKNEAYTHGGKDNNILANFDGKYITNILVEQSTHYDDWKTSETLDKNGYLNDWFPSACVCWRYCTLGTGHGDWYLPTFGEAGYFMTRAQKVNNIISKLAGRYGIELCIMGVDEYALETCISSKYDIVFSFNNIGEAAHPPKGFANSNHSTRPFLRKNLKRKVKPEQYYDVRIYEVLEFVEQYLETDDKEQSLAIYNDAINNGSERHYEYAFFKNGEYIGGGYLQDNNEWWCNEMQPYEDVYNQEIGWTHWSGGTVPILHELLYIHKGNMNIPTSKVIMTDGAA